MTHLIAFRYPQSAFSLKEVFFSLRMANAES